MKRSKQKRIWKETRRNKTCAAILIFLGILGAVISGEGTFTILMIMLSLPLLVAKENWIE